MLNSVYARRGMMVAPHHLAARAGENVLREGGNAVEAMIAAAATVAVVYPHMNSIGGDGFWLITEPGKEPVAIDASGGAAAAASTEFYSGLKRIPSRGPTAALTVAGTIAGWQAALDVTAAWQHRLPLARLLEDARTYAREGTVITAGQSQLIRAKQAELSPQPGFADRFLVDGEAPATGTLLTQPQLAETFEQLIRAGLDDFYRGELSQALATDLEALGSPLRRSDLERYHAETVAPLSLRLKHATVFNLPPPTQGLASLIILGLFDRLNCSAADGFEHVHGIVEATKQAFLIRDRYVTDRRYLDGPARAFLTDDALDELSRAIDPKHALPWPQPSHPGDTVWMGCIDGQGRAVSFIQSLYWEFGAGIVLPQTGIVWQNRGISFGLDEHAAQPLMPGRKPFHTLNPAAARLADGSSLVYGTMGGEGQPQTQAAVFTRHVHFGQTLQQAVTAPRWLLGRTWGADSTTLKLESRFGPELVDCLAAAGHRVETVAAFSDVMGHAGAIRRHRDGTLEGAYDPRSDGAVAAL